MLDRSVPGPTTTGHALRHAIRHHAVSTGVTVDVADMVRSLRTGDIGDSVRVALASHLYEAEPAEIADLIIEGSATVPGLKQLASSLLPAGHRNRVYVESFR